MKIVQAIKLALSYARGEQCPYMYEWPDNVWWAKQAHMCCQRTRHHFGPCRGTHGKFLTKRTKRF